MLPVHSMAAPDSAVSTELTDIFSIAALVSLVAALCVYTYLYSWWRERAGVAVVGLIISAIMFVIPIMIGHLLHEETDNSPVFGWVEVGALAFGLAAAVLSIYAMIRAKIRADQMKSARLNLAS